MEDTESILTRSSTLGLPVRRVICSHETGLDFRVLEVEDETGRLWMLRIPRHEVARGKIDREAKLLSRLKECWPFQSPEWRILAPDFIAYPRLDGILAYSYNIAPPEGPWRIDRNNNTFIESFARTVAALHSIPAEKIMPEDKPKQTISDVREDLLSDIARVKASLGVMARENQWREWIDNDSYWPEETVLTHGDLYAGHVVTDETGKVSGFIDWADAKFDDPSVDMSAQFVMLNPHGFLLFLRAYAESGGHLWPRVEDHVIQRAFAYPLTFATYALDSGNPLLLEKARVEIKAS